MCFSPDQFSRFAIILHDWLTEFSIFFCKGIVCRNSFSFFCNQLRKFVIFFHGLLTKFTIYFHDAGFFLDPIFNKTSVFFPWSRDEFRDLLPETIWKISRLYPWDRLTNFAIFFIEIVWRVLLFLSILFDEFRDFFVEIIWWNSRFWISGDVFTKFIIFFCIIWQNSRYFFVTDWGSTLFLSAIL